MSTLEYPLVCFDLDGTLVDDTIFIWKTLHEHFETDAATRKKAHDDYFGGRISYRQWFECDLALLDEAGATREGVVEVLDSMRAMPDAHSTLRALKERGHRIAIISGSLDIVLEHIFMDIDFDHVLINHISFDDGGRICGGVPTPYDLEGKAEGLRELCRREGIPTSRAAFVGDNSNDLWIAREAGFSVAFNCKSDELRDVCDVELGPRELSRLIDLVG